MSSSHPRASEPREGSTARRINPLTHKGSDLMATTVSHHIATLQHAIADLTGYEDADTLRWQQACVHAAQQLTGAQGHYAGTDIDQLAQGLDLAQRGGVTLARGPR